MLCRECGSQPLEVRGEDCPEKHSDLWAYPEARKMRQVQSWKLDLENRDVMFIVDDLSQVLIWFSCL